MSTYQVIQQFGETCKVAFLATVDGDRPRVRPMTPLRIEGHVLYMAADAHSDKIDQVAKNPHAELCYLAADHGHLRLSGTVSVCKDAAVKKRIWDEFPVLGSYFKSVGDPAYALLEMTITNACVMEATARQYKSLKF